jgi:hypothetical protein
MGSTYVWNSFSKHGLYIYQLCLYNMLSCGPDCASISTQHYSSKVNVNFNTELQTMKCFEAYP